MSIHAGVSSMVEMEVSPDDSQSPFPGRLSPAVSEQHQQTQSPDGTCSTLQSIESELLNDQEELASYQICASHKSTQQTPGMMDSLQSAMELVKRNISTHLQKVRLIVSWPKFNCDMHSSSTKNLGNPSATSQSASNNLKHAPNRDNDGFQLPPKRNTVKPRCLLFQIPSSPPTNWPNLNLSLFLIRPHHRLPEYPP
ncbi:hypothetical protein CDAR_61961 [Caerostris darwini]|uniref:Uncharacterized protein n=1 Tax=Caerostris darwini TaxID=1538125 RepID=A0AAV4VJA5_9ARAC|nr:hypothetical protein CDAR_61961 [Caerostris darwini]